eukprot:4005878-Alexandrium_andersonii.AAC.1
MCIRDSERAAQGPGDGGAGGRGDGRGQLPVLGGGDRMRFREQPERPTVLQPPVRPGGGWED